VGNIFLILIMLSFGKSVNALSCIFIDLFFIPSRTRIEQTTINPGFQEHKSNLKKYNHFFPEDALSSSIK